MKISFIPTIFILLTISACSTIPSETIFLTNDNRNDIMSNYIINEAKVSKELELYSLCQLDFNSIYVENNQIYFPLNFYSKVISYYPISKGFERKILVVTDFYDYRDSITNYYKYNQKYFLTTHFDFDDAYIFIDGKLTHFPPEESGLDYIPFSISNLKNHIQNKEDIEIIVYSKDGVTEKGRFILNSSYLEDELNFKLDYHISSITEYDREKSTDVFVSGYYYAHLEKASAIEQVLLPSRDLTNKLDNYLDKIETIKQHINELKITFSRYFDNQQNIYRMLENPNSFITGDGIYLNNIEIISSANNQLLCRLLDNPKYSLFILKSNDLLKDVQTGNEIIAEFANFEYLYPVFEIRSNISILLDNLFIR